MIKTIKIHVIVKLTTLLCLTIMVQKFDEITLLITLLILTTILFLHRSPNALRMFKRLRWMIFTILLVYAFNTPGEYISFGSDNPWSIVPTYEGVHAGLSQVLRLCVVVMALVLLTRVHRDELIGGLYSLFKPLSYFGLDSERFVVRLWLTLHYVENDEELKSKKKQDKRSFFVQVLNKFDALDLTEQMFDSVTLYTEKWRWTDTFLLIIVTSMTFFYMRYF